MNHLTLLAPGLQHWRSPGGRFCLHALCLVGLGRSLVAQAPPLPAGGAVPPPAEAMVRVDERSFRILPPPTRALKAADDLNLVRPVGTTAMAFLDKTLDSLTAEQALDLAYLKIDPARIQVGTDTGLFRQLYALSKDPALGRVMDTYKAAVLQAESNLDGRYRSSEMLNDLVRAKFRTKADSEEQDSLINHRPTTQELVKKDSSLEALARAATGSSASSFNAYLDEYGLAWQAYAKGLDSFLEQVVTLAKVNDSSLPASSRVLVRLLQIQLFRAYRGANKRHMELWTTAARLGELERSGERPQDEYLSITPSTPREGLQPAFTPK